MSNLYQRIQQSRSNDPVLVKGKKKDSVSSTLETNLTDLRDSRTTGRKSNAEESDSQDSRIPEFRSNAKASKNSKGITCSPTEMLSQNLSLPENAASTNGYNNLENRSNPSGERGIFKREVTWTPNGDKLSVRAPIKDPTSSPEYLTIRGVQGRLDFVTLNDDSVPGIPSYKISYNRVTSQLSSSNREQLIKESRPNTSQQSLSSEDSDDFDDASDSSPNKELLIPRSLNLAEAHSLDIMTCASEDDATTFRDDRTSCEDEAFMGELWVDMNKSRKGHTSKYEVNHFDQTKSMKYRNLMNNQSSSLQRKDYDDDDASYDYGSGIYAPTGNRFGYKRYMNTPRPIRPDLPVHTEGICEKVDKKVIQFQKGLVDDIADLDYELSQLKFSTK
jgi:hypothetical protein